MSAAISAASATNEQWINTANTTAFGDLFPARVSASASGVFGGGQMGYNWQANNFVFGLEGTISGLDNNGTVLNTVFGAPATINSAGAPTGWRRSRAGPVSPCITICST